VSAIRDLSGAVGRCVSLKERKAKGDFQYGTEMWDAWRRFDRAFAMAYRYHDKKLNKGTPVEIKEKLYTLASWLHKDWNDAGAEVQNLQKEVDKLLDRAQELLGPAE
jgi:hypothetical protein